MALLLIATRARPCFADRALILSFGWICCRVSLIYHSHGRRRRVRASRAHLSPSRRLGFDDELHPVRRSAPSEAREAAFPRFRIGDRAAFFRIHAWWKAAFAARTTHSTCCRARSDTSPGLTIGGCFTTTVRRAAAGGAAATVATVARQAAAKPKVVAIWMIITIALLRFGYRSVAISATPGMSLESRDNPGRPNVSRLPWHRLWRGGPRPPIKIGRADITPAGFELITRSKRPRRKSAQAMVPRGLSRRWCPPRSAARQQVSH
jgi:hypothetical protein